MVFNDTTTKNGAIQFCEEWLFGGDYGAISGNPTLLLKFTNGINRGLDKTLALIYQSDGRWSNDDPNYTDIPEATTNITNGVSKYNLDQDQLIIEGFAYLVNGKYETLTQRDAATSSYHDKDTGIPKEYDLIGDLVILYPTPNADLSDGLKILYKRESDYFVSTDTTKEMGIPRTFHDIPCLFACSEYASMNSMEQKMVDIENQLALRKKDLTKHFSLRNKDEKRRLLIKQESNR